VQKKALKSKVLSMGKKYFCSTPAVFL